MNQVNFNEMKERNKTTKLFFQKNVNNDLFMLALLESNGISQNTYYNLTVDDISEKTKQNMRLQNITNLEVYAKYLIKHDKDVKQFWKTGNDSITNWKDQVIFYKEFASFRKIVNRYLFLFGSRFEHGMFLSARCTISSQMQQIEKLKAYCR